MYNFAIMTEDATGADPVWSQPRRISPGVMLNKPTVLRSGAWLLPTCIWRDALSSRILRSGDHGAIARWRADQQQQRTQERRPDLYARWEQAPASEPHAAQDR
jgi:tRNA G37 N-methylase TrmD